MGFFETLKMVGLGGIVVAVGCVWFQMSMERKKARKVDNAAADITKRALAKFPAYEGCLAVDGEAHCLFINESTRMTLVATPAFAKEIPFDDYIAANIITGGATAVETRKSGVAGRVIAGGLIGGGAGAVVGALTAKSVQDHVSTTSSISLSVETTDPAFQEFGWTFFTPVGLMRDLQPHEVWIYMQNATAAYNRLAPLFVLHATEENGLVAI